MEETHRIKSFLRVLLALMVVAVGIVAVAVAVQGPDSYKNLFGGAEALADDYYYTNCFGGAFDIIDDKFIAASNSSITMFDNEGTAAFSKMYAYENVRMCGAGEYGAVYDLNGCSVLFFNGDGVIKEIVTDMPVISVSVNEDGYLCVCAQESGYYGAVTVYNRNGTDIYKWYSGVAYLLSADVDDGRLFCLSIGDGGSCLVSYSLDSEEENARYEYPGLCVDAVICGSSIALVATDNLVWLNMNLAEKSRYGYEDLYLMGFDGGDGFMVLALSEYYSGGAATIISVKANGTVTGSVTTTGKLDCLDARGENVAVLTGDTLTVCDSALQTLYRVEDVTGVEKLILLESGDVMAAGSFSAHKYTSADGSI